MTNYFLTEVSTNKKTGPIPVATTSRDTCPTSCPLIGDGGCYAEGGPLRIHWNAVSEGSKGVDFDEFCKKISRLPRRQLWRYGQAGDLPGEGDSIDVDKLRQLTAANRGRPVIAFTHKPPVGKNLEALREAAAAGFKVNLSADNPDEADQFVKLDLPTVVVLPEHYGRGKVEGLGAYRARLKEYALATPRGNRIAVCPATYTNTRCSECQACAVKRQNNIVIGFPAHGNRKKVIKAA